MMTILYRIWHFFFPLTQKPVVKEYPQYIMSDLDYRIDNYIEDYRVDNNLPILVFPYGILLAIAGSHAKYMAEKQVFSHDYANERFEQLSLRYPNCRVGEITAGNYISPMGFVEAWKASPSHNKVMLGDWDAMACATSADVNGKIYACVLFIKY